MPDKLKRKALEEQERSLKPDKPSLLPSAIKAQFPERKIEWVDPSKHPAGSPKAVPIPNHTGGKQEETLLPGNPNEPLRMPVWLRPRSKQGSGDCRFPQGGGF
jgi:hypothetical protein